MASRAVCVSKAGEEAQERIFPFSLCAPYNLLQAFSGGRERERRAFSSAEKEGKEGRVKVGPTSSYIGRLPFPLPSSIPLMSGFAIASAKRPREEKRERKEGECHI